MSEPTPDEIDFITSEVSHDLREGFHDRIRWNNRAMMLVLNAYFAAEERGRLAGWEEAREACLAIVNDDNLNCKGSTIVTRRNFRQAIAALEPGETQGEAGTA